MPSNGTQGGRSLDHQKIEAAYVGYHTEFEARLKKIAPAYERLAAVVDTDREVDTQVWLSSNPSLQEWIGPKESIKYRGESHTIRTKPWYSSVLVPMHDVMNDRLGLYKAKIARMAEAYGERIDKLWIDMLVAGVTGTTLGATYDGQNLIDTDHTHLGIGGTSQSNKVTGALSTTTLNEALDKFASIVDEFGNPIGVTPRYLLHGLSNRNTAAKLLGQGTLASGEQNFDSTHGIIPVLHPRITSTQWFLLPEGSSSVIIHRKSGPIFKAVDNPEDSFVYDTGMFKYGIEAEFGAAYGLWQEVVGGPGS